MDEINGDVYFGSVGADAQVDIKRGVIVSHADYPYITDAYGEELASLFGKESYHNSEYTLFYNNIKENVRKRIAAFSR